MEQPERGRTKRSVVVLAVLVLASIAGFSLAILGKELGSDQKLINDLRDLNPATRARAAFELSQERQPSDAAVRALTKQLGDSDDEPRGEAVAALISIGRVNDSTGTAVAKAMATVVSASDSPEIARIEATHVLGQLGVESRPGIRALLLALVSPLASLRSAAAAALGQIGIADDDVIPSLDRTVADRVGEVRAAALEALMRLRPGDVTAAHAARLMVRDTSTWVRIAAVYALRTAEHYDANIASALEVSLRDSVAEVRRGAVIAVSRLAPAVQARRQLRRLSGDSVAAVRQTAEAALRAIDAGRP